MLWKNKRAKQGGMWEEVATGRVMKGVSWHGPPCRVDREHTLEGGGQRAEQLLGEVEQ